MTHEAGQRLRKSVGSVVACRVRGRYGRRSSRGTLKVMRFSVTQVVGALAMLLSGPTQDGAVMAATTVGTTAQPTGTTNTVAATTAARHPQQQSLVDWDAQHAANPSDPTAAAMTALLRFKAGNLDRGTMALLEAANEWDWVALQYAAAGYGMMARKLAREDADREAVALTRSVALYARADFARRNRTRWPVPYPQLELAAPQTLALRGWGDAAAWLGQESEARAIFEIGVTAGHWTTALCRPDRELQTVFTKRSGDGWMSGKHHHHPVFFDPSAFPAAVSLRAHIGTIRDELNRYLEAGEDQRGGGPTTAMMGTALPGFRTESAGLHGVGGEWGQLTLVVNGKTRSQGCSWFPRTCRILETLPEVAIANGQVKISRLAPGTTIRPHCGPSNARLRIHCALVVPGQRTGHRSEGAAATFWVGGDTQQWVEGECLVFDESCEHRAVVSETADSHRVVLIADIVNPFLADPDEYMATIVPQLKAKPMLRTELLERRRTTLAQLAAAWARSAGEL
jgi:hypothetical protein